MAVFFDVVVTARMSKLAPQTVYARLRHPGVQAPPETPPLPLARCAAIHARPFDFLAFRAAKRCHHGSNINERQ